MHPPIQLENLTKTFRNGVVAVNGLDLVVPQGAVYGLAGRNGAGKTTALRVLMGLLRADSGSARLLGHDWWLATRAERQKVAYVPQAASQPDWMTLNESIQYAKHFYLRWNNGLAQTLARRWELPLNRPLRRLSGGHQRLAALLVALSTQPEILLLDEPAAGLDPIARRDLHACLAECLTRDIPTTVLLSTHLLADLERISSHVGILHKGRLLVEGRVEDWVATMRRVQVVFPGHTVPENFEIPGSIRNHSLGPVYTGVVRLVDDTQLSVVKRWPGCRLNVFPLSLEDLFLALFPSDVTRNSDTLDRPLSKTSDGNDSGGAENESETETEPEVSFAPSPTPETSR